ncbi:predicted hydrolase [Longilinea arvoryzae]|uniref:Predicted hydrolase n=1 Tax=Longilinea arvoryzae TaxID=360412 RepID=A0A0S7BBF5_9CHLR|nr:DinB family protein [Longilinea arvoryzae]GAP14999.1 predicted hydrolase [Longilinea arvoryzae]
MSLTVLLDMDDTLLTNEMERFLPAYLQELSSHLQNRVPQDRMIQFLLAGTKAMVQNQLPGKTLEQAFDEVFYPGIGCAKNELSAQLADFYANAYPALKSVTSVRPDAVEFVEWAFSQGYRIAIATNPLFPKTAIEQRLAWAGLPVTKYPFALVTSFETFHFAKPNPAYFAEILGQLEWPEGPAVMVGNSLKEDIQPAQALGISTFHLQVEASQNGANAGNFSQLKTWLKKVAKSQPTQPQTPQALTALLSSAPAALQTLSAGLDTNRWNQRPKENEWSLGEIFCHLRDVDIEVTIPRTQRIQHEDTPFITAEVTDVWAEKRHYLQENPIRALEDFTQARTRLLLQLQQLGAADWSRPARHAIFGPTTLGELLAFTITHDQNHIRQVAKTMRWLKGE